MPVRDAGRRAGCAAGVALALALAPRAAKAAPTARLVYSRTGDAASCPDEAALRHAVASRVGYDAFFPWAPRTVVVAIVRRDGAFVATVDLVDESGIDHGAHELHSRGACADLLDAVALAVSIAIDPRSILAPPAAKVDAAPLPESPPPKTPSPEPTPTVATSPPPEPPPPAVPPPRAPSRVAYEASLGGAASLGMGPGPALGGTLGGAVRVSWFSLGVEGLINAPSSTLVFGGPARVSAWTAIGAVLPCGSLGPWFACVVAQLGGLQSSADGAGNTVTRSTWWSAAGGRVGVMFPVKRPLFFRIGADLLGDILPSHVKLNLNPGVAWSTSPVAGSLGIEAVVRF